MENEDRINASGMSGGAYPGYGDEIVTVRRAEPDPALSDLAQAPPARKKKSRGKFNIIDLSIFILLVAAAAMIVYAYFPGLFSGRSGRAANALIEYRVTFEKVPAGTAGHIAAGGKVTDPDGRVLGTVVSAAEEKHREYVYSETSGAVVAAYSDDLSDLTLTISADARQTRGALETDGVRISVGAVYSVITPDFEGQGRCRSLTVAD